MKQQKIALFLILSTTIATSIFFLDEYFNDENNNLAEEGTVAGITDEAYQKQALGCIIL